MDAFPSCFLLIVIFSYKASISLSEPVSDNVRLNDLRPYTTYSLLLKARRHLRDENNNNNRRDQDHGEIQKYASFPSYFVFASLNFSTSGKKTFFTVTMLLITDLVVVVLPTFGSF